MRRLILGVLVLAGVVSAAPLAQVEIDRVLRRIEGHPITTRDVYAARELKLVAADSDAAALAALEDRRLKLLEIARIQQGPPGDAEVAARRRTWDASFTGPDDRAAPAQPRRTERRPADSLARRRRAHREVRGPALRGRARSQRRDHPLGPGSPAPLRAAAAVVRPRNRGNTEGRSVRRADLQVRRAAGSEDPVYVRDRSILSPNSVFRIPYSVFPRPDYRATRKSVSVGSSPARRSSGAMTSTTTSSLKSAR